MLPKLGARVVLNRCAQNGGEARLACGLCPTFQSVQTVSNTYVHPADVLQSSHPRASGLYLCSTSGSCAGGAHSPLWSVLKQLTQAEPARHRENLSPQPLVPFPKFGKSALVDVRGSEDCLLQTVFWNQQSEP